MRSKCRCSCVLQFTLCHAFSCVLHRPPSQLIHCIMLFSLVPRTGLKMERKKKKNSSQSFPGEGNEHRQSLLRELRTFNDPSAGSPTETLLRLLLPLNATVWSSSRYQGSVTRQGNSPRTSLKHSIGSSDGRCVQRAGT